jgi:hypothetical protein
LLRPAKVLPLQSLLKRFRNNSSLTVFYQNRE